jgi:hypothetical protein
MSSLNIWWVIAEAARQERFLFLKKRITVQIIKQTA